MLYRYQWMQQACIQIYHRRRELQQYAKHTRHSTAINLLYCHTTSKKYLNLFFRKIHSNLLETVIFRPMELQWVQKWPLRLQAYGRYWNKSDKSKQNKTNRMETFYWMTFSHCGTVTKRKLTCSLSKLTTSILQLNFWPKFQRTRQAIIITVQRVSFL